MKKDTETVSAYLERPIRSLFEACRTSSRDRGLTILPCDSCRVRGLCEVGRAKSLGYVILHPRTGTVTPHPRAKQNEPVVEQTAAAG